MRAHGYFGIQNGANVGTLLAAFRADGNRALVRDDVRAVSVRILNRSSCETMPLYAQTAIGHWCEMMFPLYSILRTEPGFARPAAQFVLLHLKRSHLMEWVRDLIPYRLDVNRRSGSRIRDHPSLFQASSVTILRCSRHGKSTSPRSIEGLCLANSIERGICKQGRLSVVSVDTQPPLNAVGACSNCGDAGCCAARAAAANRDAAGAGQYHAAVRCAFRCRVANSKAVTHTPACAYN